MAQGKPFTDEERNDIIESLKPYLMLNYDIKKSHTLAFSNLSEKYKDNIPEYTTIQKWIKNNPSLSVKVKAWRNSISANARQVWKDSIDKGNYIASKEWLERIEKETFSTRQEVLVESEDDIKIINKLDSILDKID